MRAGRAIGIGVGSLVGLVVIGVIAIGIMVDAEDIKQRALAGIRAGTGYEAEAGSAGLRIRPTGAGFRVESVRLAAPDGSQTIQAESIDIYLKLLPLLGRRVELRDVVVHRPEILVRRAELAPATPEASDLPASSPALAIFGIDSWRIENGRYEQELETSRLVLDGLDLEGGLRFDPRSGGSGWATGSAASGSWEAGTAIPLPALTLDARFITSGAADTVRVRDARIATGRIQLLVDGDVMMEPGGASWRFSARADPVAWSELQSLVPAEALQSLAGYDIETTALLEELVLSGTPGAEASFDARVRLSDLRASHRDAPLGIQNGQALLLATRNRMELRDASFRIGDDEVRIAAALELNGEPRWVEGSLAGSIDATTLGRTLPPSAPLQLARGTLDVDLKLDRPWRGVAERKIPALQGRLELRDVAGAVRELALRTDRTRIDFRGVAADLDASAHLGRSDVAVRGTIRDLSAPDMKFTWESKVVDANELFPESNPDSTDESASGFAMIGVPGSGTVRIGTLYLRKLTLSDVASDIRVDLSGLHATNGRARWHQGAVTGDLDFVPQPDNRWEYRGNFRFQDVALGSVLSDWTRLGRWIEGRGRGTLTLNGTYAQRQDPWNTLDMLGRVDVAGGTLRQIPGLSEVAGLLGVADLKPEGWPFQDLRTRFAFKQGRFVVDTLGIQQAGIAWTLSGGIGRDGSLNVGGTVRADPTRIDLPVHLQILRPYLAEADGRVPIDFRIGGGFARPAVTLDWDAVAKRATARAKTRQEEDLRKKIDQALPDPDLRDRLKKLVGKSKPDSSGG